MMPRLDGEAVTAMVEESARLLVAEFGNDLVGVMLTGSYATKLAMSGSDIDIIVVIRSSRRQRRNMILNGQEIEMFINPVAQIKRYLSQDRMNGKGTTQHMLISGTIFFEQKATMTRLQHLARTQWEEGPPPIAPNELWRVRYLPADLLRDIESLPPARPETVYLRCALMQLLLEDHYRLQRRWHPKRKRLVEDLQSWDPTGARLFRCVLTSLHGEHLEAIKAFADHVLKPVGGLMPLEWRTDWQEVAISSR